MKNYMVMNIYIYIFKKYTNTSTRHDFRLKSLYLLYDKNKVF